MDKFTENYKKCREFFDEVSKILAEDYKVVSSCNKDLSAYLVPNGTRSQITYHSKPASSFRVSDHWNWYANVKKCHDENYVQCYSVDLPNPMSRMGKGKASSPIKAPQVCLMFPDGKYHCVYGIAFDKKSRSWKWIANDAAKVAVMARGFLQVAA